MDRKEFIKKSCGVCLLMGQGVLLNAVLQACKAPLGIVKTSSKDNKVSIPLTEFDKDGFKVVRVANYNYDLAVQKRKDGTFYTLLLMCTHARQPLTKTGNNYYCTLHGSQFDHDGHVTKGPAANDLLSLKTTIEKDYLSIQLQDIF